MPRRKKRRPFINKKTAMRFQMVSRSLDEAGYVAGEATEHILRPLNARAAEAQFAARMGGDAGFLAGMMDEEFEASAAGASSGAGGAEERKGGEEGAHEGDEGPDFHTTDVIVEANGVVHETTAEMLALPPEVFASGEQLPPEMDSIALASQQMPQDVLDALEGRGEFEEMEDGDMPDDFVAMLGGMADDGDDGAGMGGGGGSGGRGYVDTATGEAFDMEAHMARLLAQAELDDMRNAGDDDELDDDEYAALVEAHRQARKAEQAAGQTKAQNMVDMQLDAVLAQYGDDEIGELDDDGASDAENDPVTATMLDDALNEFMDARDLDNNYLRVLAPNNTDAKTDAAGTTAAGTTAADAAATDATGATAADATEEADEHSGDDGEYSDDDDSGMELMEVQLPAAVRRRHVHDVETVVSTYTTTDNHPTLLDEEAPKIKLSGKTGFPIISTLRPAAAARKKQKQPTAQSAVEDGDSAEAGAGGGTNAGAGAGAGAGADMDDGVDGAAEVGAMPPSLPPQRRRKGETKAEKRARKAAVKAARQARRAAKKASKLAFKEETKKQLKRQTHGTNAAGQTVLTL